MKTKLTKFEENKFIMLAKHYGAEFLANHFKMDIELVEKLLKKYKREINPDKERHKNLSKETVLKIYKILNDDNNILTYNQISNKFNVTIETIASIKEKKSYKKFIQQVDLEIILKHLNKSLKNSDEEELKKGRDLLVKALKEY